MEKVYDEQGKKIVMVSEIGHGGEGGTYLTSDNKVVKIYKKEKITQEKENKLRLMIAQNINHQCICWPEKIVCQNGSFAGYLMPKAEGIEMQKCLFVKPLLLKNFPNWTRLNLVELCLSLLSQFSYLHQKNIIIGDINPRNILVTPEGKTYFVDTDSYQIGNFTCPVGTDNFTPPEMQSKDFKTYPRTPEAEYFAIATLLFMILLPGKPPYSHQGGGAPAENIIQRNFSYPFVTDVNWKAPEGPWEIIWNELPYNIKKAFHEVFKNGKRIGILGWNIQMEEYKNGLLKKQCTEEIFPTQVSKNEMDISISMNSQYKKIGQDTTILNQVEIPNIAILELSTRAVKLLRGNMRALKDGFDFTHFRTDSDLIGTGKFLDKHNTMNMMHFQKSVLPSIQKMVAIAEKNKVTTLYSIATAAYRSAQNIQEIIDCIKQNAGINVRVFSQEEEANSIMGAFLWSNNSNLDVFPYNDIIMIDQGGGSTQISWFQRKNSNYLLKRNKSIDLGTTVLQNVLWLNSNSNTRLEKAFEDIENSIHDRLKPELSQMDKMMDSSKKSCLSVGTAITKATGKSSNEKQHLTHLSQQDISDKITQSEEKLLSKYNSIEELRSDIEKSRDKHHNHCENLLVMRLGLAMYRIIMEAWNIPEIVVSGTAVRYGFYYQKFLDSRKYII